MAQGVLPFHYEQEKNDTGMTSLAGLPVYLDLSHAIGTWKSIEKNLMYFVLLNLGACMSDLEVIDKDEGFGCLLRRI